MALKKCEECGHDVSTKADTCPHCGAPQAGRKTKQVKVVKSKSKGVGCGTVILIAFLGLFLVMLFSNESSNTLTKKTTTTKKTNKTQTKEDYITELNKANDGAGSFDIGICLDTKDKILGCTVIFEAYADIIDRSKKYQLSSEDNKTLQQFKRRVPAVQISAFPKLRDAYGPAVRRILWENDMSAKTIGSGYRVIEFVAGEFAANRNIQAWQEEVQPILYTLRFTRARYKWYKEEDKYQYYDMKPPKDGDIVIWTSKTSFRPIK